MLHVFNPSSQQRQVNLSEFKASLIYKANFRTAKAVNTENPCLGWGVGGGKTITKKKNLENFNQTKNGILGTSYWIDNNSGENV